MKYDLTVLKFDFSLPDAGERASGSAWTDPESTTQSFPASHSSVPVYSSLTLVALTFVINNAVHERGALLKRQEQILAEKQRIYLSLGKELKCYLRLHS